MGKNEGVGTALALGMIGGAAALFGLRAAQRSQAEKVKCELSCRCGKVHGEVESIVDDAIPLICFCNSCRTYGQWVADQDDQAVSVVDDLTGGSYIITVCKSSLKIDKGMEYLKLAKLTKKTMTNRFYASCCHTPIANTGKNVGFAGVYAIALDENKKKFGRPNYSFLGEAVEKPIEERPEISFASFLWNVLRFIPNRQDGPPFDYDQTPAILHKKHHT